MSTFGIWICYHFLIARYGLWSHCGHLTDWSKPNCKIEVVIVLWGGCSAPGETTLPRKMMIWLRNFFELWFLRSWSFSGHFRMFRALKVLRAKFNQLAFITFCNMPPTDSFGLKSTCFRFSSRIHRERSINASHAQSMTSSHTNASGNNCSRSQTTGAGNNLLLTQHLSRSQSTSPSRNRNTQVDSGVFSDENNENSSHFNNAN